MLNILFKLPNCAKNANQCTCLRSSTYSKFVYAILEKTDYLIPAKMSYALSLVLEKYFC